jgi:hypothetical protein
MYFELLEKVNLYGSNTFLKILNVDSNTKFHGNLFTAFIATSCDGRTDGLTGIISIRVLMYYV